MSELITVQDNISVIPYPYDRDMFYDEQIELYKQWIAPTKYVHIINVFLINLSGEIILQKRSHGKRHNPNLLDKTIGWHAQRWDLIDYTVMLETVQELQVPSIVIRAQDDFDKKFMLLKDYLHVIALIKHVDTKGFVLQKVMKEWLIPVWNISHLFFGAYAGSVKNIDLEAKWVLFYELDDLIQEMKESPKSFTDDLHQYIHKYEKELRDFISFIKQK